MESSAANLELWKWVMAMFMSAISGAITATVTIGRVIAKLNNLDDDMVVIKKVIFKETGGLNLISEARHTEICIPHTEMMEQDLEHIKEQLSFLQTGLEKAESKIDIVVNTAHHAKQSSEDMRRLANLMAEINNKLSGPGTGGIRI